MAENQLTQFQNAEELAQAAASAWLDEIARASQTGRACCAALSGGRIAGALFSGMTRQMRARNQSLDHVHFFWSDERCVPPDDAGSNYRLARELLLDPLGIAEDRIHRVRGEVDPDEAAREAGAGLSRVVPRASDGQPVLDLILLGMGEDGHVASLFPGEPEAVRSSQAVYRAVTAPKPPPRRVTLGYQVIAAARDVWVLISGGAKEAVLCESLRPDGRTPLATVLRSRSRTRIFSDLRLK
jgi:6-phosphogluconolactonase